MNFTHCLNCKHSIPLEVYTDHPRCPYCGAGFLKPDHVLWILFGVVLLIIAWGAYSKLGRKPDDLRLAVWIPGFAAAIIAYRFLKLRTPSEEKAELCEFSVQSVGVAFFWAGVRQGRGLGDSFVLTDLTVRLIEKAKRLLAKDSGEDFIEARALAEGARSAATSLADTSSTLHGFAIGNLSFTDQLLTTSADSLLDLFKIYSESQPLAGIHPADDVGREMRDLASAIQAVLSQASGMFADPVLVRVR